jgi:hypothetical protein
MDDVYDITVTEGQLGLGFGPLPGERDLSAVVDKVRHALREHSAA